VALPEITTERLRIVIASPGLEEPLARFYRENFEGHLDRWSPPMPGDKLEAAYWARQLPVYAAEFEAGTSARWVLLAPRDEPAEVVGTCNFTQIAGGPFRACVLGYQLARQREGQGLMREALTATIGFAFRDLRLHRVMANYRPENHRSGRLLERLGFVREGYARDYLFIDGAWRDHILTSRTNANFDPAWLGLQAQWGAR
jgi:[ribosomal protein S5]-alanine N-acetyltransferase